jgi:hypothetical protein
MKNLTSDTPVNCKIAVDKWFTPVCFATILLKGPYKLTMLRTQKNKCDIPSCYKKKELLFLVSMIRKCSSLTEPYRGLYTKKLNINKGSSW